VLETTERGAGTGVRTEDFGGFFALGFGAALDLDTVDLVDFLVEVFPFNGSG